MTENRSGTLVVGASQAGLQLATSLRELGDTEPIVLVGMEKHPPYQRPPLSKAYLAGRADAQSLHFRKPEWYAEQQIDLRLSTKITSITLDDATSGAGVAVTEAGEVLPFARLALTVGGRARRIQLPGTELAGVKVLRHLRNAKELRDGLTDAQDVVVVGGGFIGLEAASAATAAGKRVTVVDIGDRLLGRAVAPVVSDFYLEAHRRRGTTIRLETGVTAFEGSEGRVSGVRLGDGSLLPADLVLVGIGLEPRTELAEELGLACDGGIVVDSGARTSHPGVVAAGDCTVMPHPLGGHGLVRIESVQNAVAQAHVAASSLLGITSTVHAVPWFWSDQADLKLQIAGLSAGYDQVVVRGDPTTESFSTLYYADGQLIACDAVNAVRDYLVVRKALGEGRTVPADLAADTTRPLKELVVDKPRAIPA